MPYKSKDYYLNNKNFNRKIFANSKKLQKLLKLAKTGKYSSLELSHRFNCNRKAIIYALYSKKIILPNLGRFRKRIICNNLFFDKLNPHSAYWAGFIAADGNLYKKENLISIGLNWKDLNHLKKFKRALKTNAKIRLVKSNKSAQIRFRSEKVFDDLVNLGITPNKSLTISEVKIPMILMPDFLRGVYDGDGSISGKDRSHLQLCIVGNKPFLEYIQNIFIKQIKINKTKIYDMKNCLAKRIQYTGIQTIKILDFFYKNSDNNTRLDRKYKNYLLLKREYTG